MMKLIGMTRVWLLLVLLSLAACDKNTSDNYIDADVSPTATVTDKNLELVFTTSSMGGEYSPNHVLAVWVETASGDFVRSLKVRAQQRKTYLYTWKSASGSDLTDAITGATISKHTTHTINWNLQSNQQVDVANGDYQIKLEMTDKNKQGAVASLPFSIQDSIKSQSFEDATYFKNVSIVYTQTITE